MEKSVKKKLMNDIENRLDNFFDEDVFESSAASPAVSMEKLKSVVLSIDWEITETCLTDLIIETDALLPHFENDRLSHTLLRMLRAVGRYIRQHKAQAHPNAIKLVMSVFNGIEKLTLNPALPEDQKNAIVAKEISTFKKLKQQITGTSEPSSAKAGPFTTTGTGDFVNQNSLTQTIGEVERRLNAQVETLKTQLDSLRKELSELRDGKD